MNQRTIVIIGSLALVSAAGFLVSRAGSGTLPEPSQLVENQSANKSSATPIALRIAKLEDQVRALEARLTAPSENVGAKLTDAVSVTSSTVVEVPVSPPADDTPIYPLSFAADGSEVDDPFLGNSDAPLVLMAFSNYNCRTCERFFQDTFPTLKKESIDTGSVRFILRDLPVERNGPADALAIAANCAGAQGKYWQAHETLLKRKKADSDVRKLFKAISGLDLGKWDKCTTNTRYQREISGDISDAKRLGATGSPSFFIGKREKGFLKGVFLRGAQPLSLFRSQIAKLK